MRLRGREHCHIGTIFSSQSLVRGDQVSLWEVLPVIWVSLALNEVPEVEKRLPPSKSPPQSETFVFWGDCQFWLFHLFLCGKKETHWITCSLLFHLYFFICLLLPGLISCVHFIYSLSSCCFSEATLDPSQGNYSFKKPSLGSTLDWVIYLFF